MTSVRYIAMILLLAGCAGSPRLTEEEQRAGNCAFVRKWARMMERHLQCGAEPVRLEEPI